LLPNRGLQSLVQNSELAVFRFSLVAALVEFDFVSRLIGYGLG
jgi:hypothetical protein